MISRQQDEVYALQAFSLFWLNVSNCIMELVSILIGLRGKTYIVPDMLALTASLIL